MQTFITVLITILVFGVIIFIHELGHFIAAKLSGITVHEFALGMGPTIFHFEKGGTKYAVVPDRRVRQHGGRGQRIGG